MSHSQVVYDYLFLKYNLKNRFKNKLKIILSLKYYIKN